MRGSASPNRPLIAVHEARKMTLRTTKWADPWRLGLNPPKVANGDQFLLAQRYGALYLLTSAEEHDFSGALDGLADSVMIVCGAFFVYCCARPLGRHHARFRPIHPGLMPAEVQNCQKQAVFMPDSPRPDARLRIASGCSAPL